MRPLLFWDVIQRRLVVISQKNEDLNHQVQFGMLEKILVSSYGHA